MTTATRVDEAALRLLKTQVLRRNGSLRGFLQDEVTAAVRARALEMANDR